MYEVVIEVASSKDEDALAMILYRAGYSPYKAEPTGNKRYVAIQIACDDVHKLSLQHVKEK